MNLLAWLALAIVCTIGFAALWSRWTREARELEDVRCDLYDEVVEPAPVVECRLCGPTAAAIQEDEFCWRCWPHVKAARLNYGHTERA